MKKKVKEFLFNLICSFIEKKTNYSLQYFSQLRAENRFCKASAAEISDILDGNKINVVDVGARGGLESHLVRYIDMLDVTLCEPDPKEAARLREEGVGRVFDSLVGRDQSENKNLCIGAHPGTSSCFDINSDYLDFYCSGSSDRFFPIETIERPTISLATLLESVISDIDYLKIDTQGSELEILEGLGRFRPIIIKCEVSYIPLYKNSALIHDIQKHLFDLGYILFHVSSVMRSAPSRHNSKQPFSKTVIPLHGDAYFMPDWSRWSSVVGARVKQYQALMKMFGLEDIFAYSMARTSHADSKVKYS